MDREQIVYDNLTGEIKVGFSAVDFSSASNDGVEYRRPLECVAMAIVGGDSTIVVISTDACLFGTASNEAMQKKIGEAVSIPPEHVLIHTTHTHSSPWDIGMVGTPPFDAFVGFLIQGVSEAIANAKPARVKAGETDVGKSLSLHRRGDAGADLGVQTFWYGYIYHDGDDRPDASALAHEMKSRWLGKKSEYKVGDEPIWFDGPVDPLVKAVCFEDMDGNTLGSIVRFCAHSHLCCCLKNRIHDPDYPGRVRDVMEEKLGGICMFLLGPSANLVPKDKARYKIDHDREPEHPYFGPSSALCCVDDDELLAETERIGKEIAEAAIKGLAAASLEPLESVRFLCKPCAIPLNPALPRRKEEAIEMTKALVPEYEAFLRAGGPLREIRRLVNRLNWLRWSGWRNPRTVSDEEQDAGVKILPISALTLNSTSMVFTFSETTVETTLALREAYPAQNLWTISLTGGSTGYFPTAEMIDEGGYEGCATIIGRDGEEKLRDQIQAMLGEIGIS